MEGLSGQQLEEATSFFTVIRRAEMGSEFRTEPYSQAFQAELRGIQRQLRLGESSFVFFIIVVYDEASCND